MLDAAAVLCAYLTGSIPFGLLAGRLQGVDLREHGSGNLGATNAHRILGLRWGLGVLLLDAAKGAVPAGLYGTLAIRLGATALDPGRLALACGLAAILGHVFPVYLRFRGGKGVATTTGVLALLAPLPMLAGFGVWLAAVLATRYVSLGSILAAMAIPTAVGLLPAGLLAAPWPAPAPARLDLLVATILLGGLVVVRHRGNIRRLLAGEERRVG